MRTTAVVSAEPGSIRPDLPIPLAPLESPAGLLRRLTFGPGRSFQRARNVTLGWLAAAALTVIVDRLLVAHLVTSCVAVVLVGYAIARVAALVIVERRQNVFEWRWLADQSRLLRRHSFEVIAFRVRITADDSRSAVRILDLTNPADVEWLLARQADSESASSLQARIEFGYWPTDSFGRGSDSVRRGLTDLEVHPVDVPLGRARVRFPQARYVTVAEDSGSGSRWPGRVASWSLIGPVLLTTARPAPAT
ncbi:hypothetical protein Vqi01_15770 [Micromonospora qiuiae]|uniref:Uncharacterized protein n=1 Tax=Micromonospora qiuiae TaxID=502268 RepID=A0ABQ4J8C3_9ACTN|nr:hypothetical protein Vqi01_15770 [Micromonospora qiuiae]